MPHDSRLAETLTDHATASAVVPERPDAPGVPFPHVAENAYDAELEAIADARSRPATRALFVGRLLSIVAAAALAFALRHDLRYALSPTAPIELGSSSSSSELVAASHRYVSLRGIPGAVGAVDYRRPLGRGLYRLAPLVDRPDIFVELRLPEGDPTRFVPPTSVQGRLVPLDEGGARFSNVREMLARTTGHSVPASAWLLEQGAAPSFVAAGAVIAAIALLLAAFQVAFLLAGRHYASAR